MQNPSRDQWKPIFGTMYRRLAVADDWEKISDQQRAERLREAMAAEDKMYGRPARFSEDFDFDEAAVNKNLRKFPDLEAWLPELAERFETMSDFTEPEIEEVVKSFAEQKGTKLGVIMNGARTLLTGVAVGPSMLSVFETLGKERSMMRLKSKVAWNS